MYQIEAISSLIQIIQFECMVYKPFPDEDRLALTKTQLQIGTFQIFSLLKSSFSVRRCIQKLHISRPEWVRITLSDFGVLWSIKQVISIFGISDSHGVSPNEYYCPATHLIFLFFFFQSDIVDVNEIFKDLAIMVHEQGETIGEIFYISENIFWLYFSRWI